MTNLSQGGEIQQITETQGMLGMPELNSFTKGITQDVEGILDFNGVDLSWIEEKEEKELLTIEHVEMIKTILDSDAYKKSVHHKEYILERLKIYVRMDTILFRNAKGDPETEQAMIDWHRELVTARLKTLHADLKTIERLKPANLVDINDYSTGALQSYLENTY